MISTNLLYAVIDIGSFNIAVIIYRKVNNDLRTVFEKHMIIADSSLSSAQAIKKICEILTEFIDLAQQHQVDIENIFILATQYLRDNPLTVLISEWLRKYNLQLQVISGQDEAFYNFLAVKENFHSNNFLTVDIGGGSIEFSIYKNGNLEHLKSLKAGVLELSGPDFDSKIQSLIVNKISDLKYFADCNTKIIATGLIPQNILVLFKEILHEQQNFIDAESLNKLLLAVRKRPGNLIDFSHLGDYSVQKMHVITAVSILLKLTHFFKKVIYCCTYDLKFGFLFNYFGINQLNDKRTYD